jgi:hypothetical protein
VSSSVTYYQDSDGDGFGNSLVTQSGCVAPTGYVTNALDCNDTNLAINPSATEICNNLDDDCDTVIDEGFDIDNDGVTICQGDCDDNNALAYPGAFELCNGSDEDCDTIIDEGYDQDGDGFTVCGGDCNDNDPNTYPGATEICGNNIDEDCSGGLNNGCPLFTYYLDNDNDGYGTATSSITSHDVTPPAGYASLAGDCNDNNAAVRPGAQELCITNYDDDCDGFVNEGCIINPVSNDDQSTATVVQGNTFPSCSSITLNLLNATNSPQASSNEPLGAGQDAWYSFVAQSVGVRIQGLSVVNDLVIELHHSSGTLVAMENATGVGGAEVLVANNLIAGDNYFVAVRNFNTAAVGTCNICIQHLSPSEPDNGTTFTSLCGAFKCDWSGASNYSVTFDDGENQYVGTNGSNTNIPFANFGGLEYNTTYDVTITSTYLQNNGTGANPTAVVVVSPVFQVTILQHAQVFLRAVDACPAVRTLNSWISTDRWICGTTTWQWEFVRVDPNNPSEVLDVNPVFVNTNSTSRFMRVNQIPGVQAGDRYRVRVRPMFGAQHGAFASTFTDLCISGGLNSGTGQTPEAHFAERIGTQESQMDFGLFPNPNRGDKFTLMASGLTNERVLVRIIDAMGKTVYNQPIAVDGILYTEISPSNLLVSGIYLIELMDGDNRREFRMIVE